jgi:hypothetical protein
MSIQTKHRRAVQGFISHRLLVNAIVDPDEAAGHLPAGVRPHITADGTVVGCCLLAIERLRPAGVPPMLGVGIHAAAHRISVEWEDESGTTVGVYVPMRHTDSRPATMLGGRWFPGVHRAAIIQVVNDDCRLRWLVDPRRSGDRSRIHVEASIPSAAAAEPCEPIGGTCLAASVGLSPNHRGHLEAARMQPEHRAALPVEIIDLDSQFLTSFESGRPAPSYLMRDVRVIWTPDSAPRQGAWEMST